MRNIFRSKVSHHESIGINSGTEKNTENAMLLLCALCVSVRNNYSPRKNFPL